MCVFLLPTASWLHVYMNAVYVIVYIKKKDGCTTFLSIF